MSEEQERTEQISFSKEEFSDLLTSLVNKITSQTNASNRELVGAILKSREPFVSDEAKADAQALKDQMRRQHDQLEANRLADQARCEHIQGSNSLSDYPSVYGRTSIIWHVLDTQEVIGVCTNCTRVFRSCDPDYETWRRKPSGNRMSSAGQRFFADPLAVMRKGQEASGAKTDSK
jgi:ribosomal protein L32